MKRNIELAEKISKANKGKLPNPWKLIQMGHGGLYIYIKRHPKVFERFCYEQVLGVDQKRRTAFSISVRDGHVKTATKLSKEYSGLPNFSWLNTNGHSRLASYMRAYPEVFAEIDSNGTPKTKKRSF